MKTTILLTLAVLILIAGMAVSFGFDPLNVRDDTFPVPRVSPMPIPSITPAPPPNPLPPDWAACLKRDAYGHIVFCNALYFPEIRR